MQKNPKNKKHEYRNLIISASLPVIFWGGVFLWWFVNPGTSADATPIVISRSPQSSIQKSISDLAVSNSSLDADGDGLFDWEESIYGTKPDNKDTDGDGYLDGEEIISRRDPLKKGDDALASTETTNKADKSQGLTATEKFAQASMANFLTGTEGQDLSTITPEQINQLVANSFNSESSNKEFDTLLKSELYYFIPSNLDEVIKISKNDDDVSHKLYWEDISKIFTEMGNTEPKYDIFETINQSIQTKNHSKTDEFANFYKKTFSDTLEISVPKSLTSNHKNLLGFLYKMQRINESARSYETDPMRTLLALNELATIAKDMFSTNSTK